MGNPSKLTGFIQQDRFCGLIDHLYDEILIYDNNYRIVYINQACSRHYACKPKDMIGKSFFDLIDNGWWTPSVLPTIYKEKKPYAVKQRTFTGSELLTVAVPVFDAAGEIEYVLMNVRDEVNSVEMWNPKYSSAASLDLQRSPIAQSPEMLKVVEMARRLSLVDVSCILSGESGTGKTMLAKYMHSLSARKSHAFVNLNCASIPQELIEAELFGLIADGVYGEEKKGLFASADKGTILLDEISELSLSAQAKILHVLQEQTFIPLGGTEYQRVDVRIIATTNKNLRNLVESGQFREDLYYRINVVEMFVPSLRKHKQDIPFLTEVFLEEFNNKYGVAKTISQKAVEVLTEYEWPGNVRELRHVVERLVVTTDEIELNTTNLPKNLFGINDESFGGAQPQPETQELPMDTAALEESVLDKIYRPGMGHEAFTEYFEAWLVKKAYKEHQSSRKVALALGISQTKANKLIQKYV